MRDDRLQILTMVQEGKLSPEEAAKLLDALGQAPERPRGRPPTHIRFTVVEGGKTKNFSVGLPIATWLLDLTGNVTFNVQGGARKLDMAMIRAAVESGTVGKIFEAEEGKQRIEIWLDV